MPATVPRAEGSNSAYGLVWFAGDPQGCARVNSALDWYHGNVRLPAIKLTWYVMAQTMQHIDKTKHVNEHTAHGQLAVLNNTLKVMYRNTPTRPCNPAPSPLFRGLTPLGEVLSLALHAVELLNRYTPRC